jgi:hypothetical protein
VGLEQIGSAFVPTTDSSTSSGYTIQLIAVHANQAETVLVVKVQPAGRLVAGDKTQLELTDQFGQVYYERLVAAAPEGHQVLLFDPIRQPAASAGARLTLMISGLQLPGYPRDQILGHWSLHATVIPERVSLVPGAGASATFGDSVLNVDSVEISRSIIQLHLTLTGPRASRLGNYLEVPGKKPQPAISLALTSREGEGHVVTYEILGEGHVVVTWTRPGPGDYVLTATALDGTMAQIRVRVR